MVFKRRPRNKISFSIFAATYNRAATFLPQNIASIQNQAGDNFTYEHIIINNASSDSTAAYLKKAAAQFENLKVINSRSNLGTAGAFNKALKIATGDFIITMGDDDMLLPYSLKMHADFLLSHPGVEWTSGYTLPIDDKNQLVDYEISRIYNTDDYKESANELFERLLAGNVIMCPSTAVKREAVIETGGWDESVKCEDWDMWLKMAHAKRKYLKNRSYLSLYRLHAGQVTNTHTLDGTHRKDLDKFRKRYGRQPVGA